MNVSTQAAPRRPRRSRKRTLGLVCVIAIAAAAISPFALAVLAEGYARINCLPAIGSVLERDPYKTLILTDSPRGITPPTTLSTNRWGMRGDEPPRDWYRWDTFIAVGSSTTLCYSLDDHKTWPYLIQQRLQAARKLQGRSPRPVWVGNAGQDGVTTVSSALLMDVVIRRLHPTVVLLMVGASDAALSFSDERREGGSPYDRAFEKRIAREMDKTSLKERSRLFREYNLWKRRNAHDVTTLAKAAHASRFPVPLSAPEEAVPIDSLLLGPEAGFAANILRIHELAGDMGTRDIFLTQPCLFGNDSSWAARESRSVQFHGRDYTISAATDRRILDRFNARLLKLCGAHHLECFDLAPLVPNDSLNFYDEAHFTEAGAAQVADAVSGYLLSHPNVP